MNTVRCFVVFVEEFDDEPPFGSDKLINRECVHAGRSKDEAKEVYDSHAEFWADKSRFSVVWREEYVRPQMARMLPEPKAAKEAV